MELQTSFGLAWRSGLRIDRHDPCTSIDEFARRQNWHLREVVEDEHCATSAKCWIQVVVAE